MARPVKCFVTGKRGTNETFVKHDNHYFESEEVYQNYRREIDYHKKIIELIVYDYMGYSKEMEFPSILNKRLNSIKHMGGYETIYRTLLDQDDTIRKAIQEKKFDSNYLKMMYILGIVKNNIFKIWKIVLAEKREAKNVKELPITTIQDLSEVHNPKQKVKDISKFLGD